MLLVLLPVVVIHAVAEAAVMVPCFIIRGREGVAAAEDGPAEGGRAALVVTVFRLKKKRWGDVGICVAAVAVAEDPVGAEEEAAGDETCWWWPMFDGEAAEGTMGVPPIRRLGLLPLIPSMIVGVSIGTAIPLCTPRCEEDGVVVVAAAD